MKKWTSLLLALAMALSLAACGDSGTQENTSEPPASVSGSTGEETPAPTGTETPAWKMSHVQHPLTINRLNPRKHPLKALQRYFQCQIER